LFRKGPISGLGDSLRRRLGAVFEQQHFLIAPGGALQVRPKDLESVLGGQDMKRESERFLLGTSFLCLFVSLTPAFGQNAPMKVWAIGDYYRINPITSKAIEDDPLLFPECLTGRYQESNLVWDGAAKTIHIKAARNEITAFQVIVERSGDDPLTGVKLEFADLVGPSGSRISAGQFDLFKEWYVDVKKASNQSYTLGTGWYPDALIPCLHWTGDRFPSSEIMPFNVPDYINNIGPKQKSQALWVDLYIPKERNQAPPGTYTSEIRVSSNTGSVDLTLKVEVWDFMLPEETHLAGNVHNDTDINTLVPELETKYYQMFRRHRLALGTLGYAPGIEVSGTDVRFDWSKYDARLGKYLDGSAFTEKYGYSGPGYGIPIEYLVLPFDAYPLNLYFTLRRPGSLYGKEWKFYRAWPVPVPQAGPTPEYRETWKKAFKGFQDHLVQRGWTKTQPIVFLLSLDESYDAASIDKLLLYGQLLKESGADLLKYRIDGWYPAETMKRLSGYVDIAILGLGDYDPVKVNPLKEAGLAPWFYTGVGTLDADPLQCRALSWLAWKYGAASWTIWEMDFNSLRAWQYAETYPGTNGAGFSVYRGEAMGLDEPVASIRFKLLRRGTQDYEYFWLLSQNQGKKSAADEAVASVIHNFIGLEGPMGAPGMWNHNPEEWERARIRVGDLISAGE